MKYFKNLGLTALTFTVLGLLLYLQKDLLADSIPKSLTQTILPNSLSPALAPTTQLLPNEILPAARLKDTVTAKLKVIAESTKSLISTPTASPTVVPYTVHSMMSNTFPTSKPDALGSSTPLLSALIQDYFKASRIQGRLGFSIYSTKYQRFEAAGNDTEWFTPASCLKLLVTSAVLDTFPKNFFPITTLELKGRLQNHKFIGNILISGEGDPNVSDRFYPDAISAFQAWGDSLRQLGIDTIQGNIEVADTFFNGPHRPKAWKQHHFNTWYGAEVSALSFNDNCYNVSVSPGGKPGAPAIVSIVPNVGYVQVINKAKTTKGKRRAIYIKPSPSSNVLTVQGQIGLDALGPTLILPVRNPVGYFQAAFIKALAMQKLGYIADTNQKNKETFKLLRFTSAPLINVLEEVNQRSQNLHAEILLRHLGKWTHGIGSDSTGLLAEREFLTRNNLRADDFNIHDGCGLSPDNRLKPRAMALLLAKMARHHYVADYIGSLATPGMDGATGRRLKNMLDNPLIRYKTGSISGVQGLCGFMFGIDGDTLAFSFFINDFHGASERASNVLDSIATRTALWFNKERPAVEDAYRLYQATDIPKTFPDRLLYFSHILEGKPYFLGPTGEGRFGRVEASPLMDLSRFDCVTYIESVLSLALAQETKEVLPEILKLRYRSDTVDYITRNHFFVEDWLKHNSPKVKIYRFAGDTLWKKPLAKIKFFQGHNLPTPAVDPICDIPFMPYEKALQLVSNWKNAPKLLGVAFVTSIAGLDVTHTGFVITDATGIPKLRDASQLNKQVITHDFKDYLISRKGKCAGVLFFEFLDPSAPK